MTQKMLLLMLILTMAQNPENGCKSLHEKPYFPSPGISWKAQKY